MLKNNLFNRKNKYQLIHSLDKEQFERITCSFYRYIKIDDLINIRNQLYTKLIELHCLGRIYIAKEGINAQVSVPTPNWDAFIYILDSFTEFNNMHIKPAVTHSKYSFIKLIVRVKKKIVADGLTDDLIISQDDATYLSAAEFNEAMDDPNSIVVDIRNYYESEVGHFDDAICPDAATFKELLPIVKEMLNNKKRNKLLLYCTGGIRCEKTSAYLKHHGFKNVSQLHGGIIDYVRQLDKDKSLENKFEGKNFVFDERRGERITDDVISSCHQCGEPFDTHVNCRNVNCNLLFLQCDSCKKKYENCCSVDCIEITNLSAEKQKELRKETDNKKMYYSHKRVNLKLKTE